ncbi:unnamed protein product, partial [Nesidiocoris tenuis]
MAACNGRPPAASQEVDRDGPFGLIPYLVTMEPDDPQLMASPVLETGQAVPRKRLGFPG